MLHVPCNWLEWPQAMASIKESNALRKPVTILLTQTRFLDPVQREIEHPNLKQVPALEAPRACLNCQNISKGNRGRVLVLLHKLVLHLVTSHCNAGMS